MIEEAKVIELTRIVKTSFRDMRRNGWMSVAATSVMALTLLIAGLFVVFAVVVNRTARGAQEKVNVAVINLSNSADSAEVSELTAAVRALGEVSSVTFVSKEEALARFREQHQNEPLILEAVKEENPLLNSLEVKVADPKYLTAVKDLIGQQRFQGTVENFSFQGEKQKTVERIAKIARFVNRLGLALSVVFAIVTLLIIFNSVRISIFSRKTEIEIMKLVGATKKFIRYPFVLEGALYGLAGAAVAMAVILLFMSGASTFLARYFADVGNISGYLTSNLWLLLVGEAVAGIAIGGGSSFVAVSRYLDI